MSYNPGTYKVIDATTYGMSTALADNTSAFNAAISALKASGQFGIIHIPGPGTYNFTQGITFDPATFGIESSGATLQYNGSINSDFITIAASTDGTNDITTFSTARCSYEGFIVLGTAGTLTGGTGSGHAIYVNSASYDTAHFVLRDLFVAFCGVGIGFYNNAYLIHMDHVNIGGNVIGMQILSGGTNNGENISGEHVAIFDNYSYAIDMEEGKGDFFFTNSSIDYNNFGSGGASINITAGHMTFVNCHIENSANKLIQTAANTITTFVGCTCVQQASSGSSPYIDMNGHPGFISFVGGSIIPNGSTTNPIEVGSGAFFHLSGTEVQYSGNPLSSFGTGKYFFSPQNPNDNLIITNYNLSSAGFSSSGGFLSTATVSIPSTSTNTPLRLGGQAGLLILHDVTATGLAMYELDTVAGATLVGSNGITGLQTPTFTGGDWNIEVTSGTTPRVIGFNVAGTP